MIPRCWLLVAHTIIHLLVIIKAHARSLICSWIFGNKQQNSKLIGWAPSSYLWDTTAPWSSVVFKQSARSDLSKMLRSSIPSRRYHTRLPASTNCLKMSKKSLASSNCLKISNLLSSRTWSSQKTPIYWEARWQSDLIQIASLYRIYLKVQIRTINQLRNSNKMLQIHCTP